MSIPVQNAGWIAPESAQRRREQRGRQRLRPGIDRLEGRVLPATFSQVGFPVSPFIEPTGGGGEPAAASAAASPTRVLSAVNGTLQVTDRTDPSSSSQIGLTTGTSPFFASVDHTGTNWSAFDPSVIYDPYAQRFWVIMAESNSSTGDSCLDVAVSTASGPTLNASDWHFQTIPASTTVNQEVFPADYPRAAVDPTNLYISVNYGPSSALFAGIFRLNKSLIIDGQPLTGNLSPFLPGNGVASLEPAQSYDSPPGADQYFVDSAAANGGGIQVWSWAPTDSAPKLQATITSAFTTLSPPGVPQPGTPVYVDTMDSRLTNAVYRNGFIATAQTVDVNGLAAVKWYELNVPSQVYPNAAYGLVQSGTISVAGSNTFDPEVAVDAQGDLGITYTQSDGSTYPQVMFTGRAANDGYDTLQTPVVVQTSSSSIDQDTYTSSSGTQTISRWGPWQGLAVDPSAPTFWALGEYVDTSSQWGAAWGEFQFPSVAQPLAITGWSPNGPNTMYTSLPNGDVVITFNQELQGFLPTPPGGSPQSFPAGLTDNTSAVTLIPWGPDGKADAGDIPVNGILNYAIVAGGSTITFTPTVPLGTDVYSIGVSGLLTSISGSPLTASNGSTGEEYNSFLLRYNPITSNPPAVTQVTVNNGAVVVNNNIIPWFDALAITFNKAMDIQHVNGASIQLWEQTGGGAWNKIPSVVAYSPGTLTAYLVPTETLPYGTTAL